MTVTRVVTLVETAKPSEKSDLPSYSFVENDGETEWLGGKTPPATKHYDIVTSIVTVKPGANAVTVTRPQLLVGAGHTGLGKDGWNSTAYPSATSKTESSHALLQQSSAASSSSKPVYDKHASFFQYRSPQTSCQSSPRALPKSRRRRRRRYG